MIRKHYLLTVIMILFIMIFNSCQNETQNESRFIGGNSFSKASFNDLGDLKNLLNSKCARLANDPSWLNSAYAVNTKDYPVELVKLFGDESSQIVYDGIEYTIKVELANLNYADQLNKAAGSYSYAVGLESDYFYPLASSLPVYVHTANGMESQSISIVSDESEIENTIEMETAMSNVPYPLFIVSISETFDDPVIDREFRQSIAPRLNLEAGTNPFFVIKEVTMKRKKDDGHADLELYFGENINNSGRINSITIHKFDGGTRLDAAGGVNGRQAVKYEDVNHNRLYEMPNDIAILPLAGVTARIVGIENDNRAGKLNRNYGGLKNFNITHFRTPTKTLLTTTWEFITQRTHNDGQDDIYNGSGIDLINEYNLNRVLDGRQYFNTNESTNGSLYHIDWKASLRLY